MSDRPPRPEATDHTVYEWDDDLETWVEREKTEDELEAEKPPEPVFLPRPEDTLTSTWEPQLVEVAGVPTWTWIERLWTAQERADRQAEADRRALRDAVRGIIVDLQAEKARVQPVLDKAANTITGSDTKDVARAVRRIADAVIDLARYVG